MVKLEGWHNQFQSKFGKPSMNLNVMVARLYEEAKLVPLQYALLGEGALTRGQKNNKYNINKRKKYSEA